MDLTNSKRANVDVIETVSTCWTFKLSGILTFAFALTVPKIMTNRITFNIFSSVRNDETFIVVRSFRYLYITRLVNWKTLVTKVLK